MNIHFFYMLHCFFSATAIIHYPSLLRCNVFFGSSLFLIRLFLFTFWSNLKAWNMNLVNATPLMVLVVANATMLLVLLVQNVGVLLVLMIKIKEWPPSSNQFKVYVAFEDYGSWVNGYPALYFCVLSVVLVPTQYWIDFMICFRNVNLRYYLLLLTKQDADVITTFGIFM